MNYIRLTEGLTKGFLIPTTESVWDHIKTNEKDYYSSLFKYNDEHYKQWKEKNTVAGLTGQLTNRIFFDFDDGDNPENARQDAILLVTRLLGRGIPEDNIQVAFSGSKGYCVELLTTAEFTQEEFKNVTFALASDLESFDTVVNDSNRIIRIVGTKHPKSGLYKFPLSVKQLSELDTDIIKGLAKDIDNIDEDIMESWIEVELPDSITKLRLSAKKEEKKVTTEANDLDMRLKPKWLSEAKYALQEGYFGSGERNTAFMVLASTYKNQGFNKEIIYRMLKGVAEVQATRNGHDRYSDEELYKNIVEVVCSPLWKGGQYSYDNTPLLRDVTDRLSLNKPTTEDSPFIPVENVIETFKRFAIDIDKNTIKLGIPIIDESVRVTTSMMVGLLAAPGSGKTSLSLSILNACSKNKVNSVFFSLDMAAPLVFQRLMQKHTGLQSKKIFDMYKSEDPKLKELEQRVFKEYANVKFCFKSGITPENIREFVIEQQEKTGEKIKLVVIDYLECIAGPFSDATANTSMIAQKLKDIANELEVCVVLLLQPQKHAGDPSAELLSYRNIKGSSAIEQAASIVFTMWRPGFSPKNPDEDKYVTLAVVKNRMGTLATFDLGWEGVTGEVRELDDLELGELNELRKRKQAEKAHDEL